MPGQVASSRSSASTIKSRSSATTRSAAGTEIPDEGSNTPLRAQICRVFGEVQKSNIGQRKLVVSLRKIQEACCYEPADAHKRTSDEDFDEADFNEEICRCMYRILPVKKSEPVGDRIVRFLGAFLKHASEQDNGIFAAEESELETIPETPSSRLTTQIISLLIPLLPAKDKIVRFRCTQIIAHLINTLDPVDDELFHHIRLGLLKRLRDRESNVRVQAVYGLGRLAGEMDADQMDEDDSDDDAAGGVLSKLLDILQNDPSAEVRRSLLLNLPFTPSTLPYLLERARDMDASIRRALYSRLLPALGDFRHLSLTHREKLLRWGMRDRDDNVKKATARLFRERWIEDCVRPVEEDDESADPSQVSAPSSEGLLELLERIDIVNAGTEGGIALDAMREFWQGRPDYCDFMSFGEGYWKDLSPESAFVARTFNDFAQSSSAYEDKLPEVTRLAYLLQTNINALVDRVQQSTFQPDTEEGFVQQEFIVEQLLHIALTLDYSDEVGRRTMYSLMREALALAELPEESTKLVVEVLRAACGHGSSAEKDFSNVVLEAIAEVHDTIMGEPQEKPEADVDDSFHSARSALSGETTPKNQMSEDYDEEKAVKEIMVNMKCLHIAQCMLQNVEQALAENSALLTMLNNLVVPAVRSQEAPIRERGLLCLGLCCLLDKNLAEENLELFLLCFSKGHESLQSIAIQIIGDILSAHPAMLSTSVSGVEQVEHPLHKPIHKLFSKSLKSQSHHVQATACTALAKLMLSTPPSSSEGSGNILNHDELLRMLTVAYFDPNSSSNSSLRQSLTYFLPVYCHSRKENMQRMGRVALAVLHWCLSVKEEMEVQAEEIGDTEMVGLAVVVAHLVDWTDGRKLAPLVLGQVNGSGTEGDCDVHLQLAEELLEKILGVCSKQERKVSISMLGKLQITSTQDTERLQTVTRLVQEAMDEKVADDAPTRNALNKLSASIAKLQSAPSRSRAASRVPSIAPSMADDGETVAEEAGRDSEGSGTVRDGTESVAPETPASSPRKKGRSKAAGSPGRRTTRQLTPLEEAASDDVMAAAAEDGSLTLAEGPTIPEEAPKRQPSQRASRPRWKPDELLQNDEISEQHATSSEHVDTVNNDTADASAIEAPKRRGRPARPALGATDFNAVPTAHARAGRKSVRASRRQQQTATSPADPDESLLD